MVVIRRFKHKKREEYIDIMPDEYSESPRSWDNLGTIYTWLRKYEIGDKHNYKTFQEFLLDVCSYYTDVSYDEYIDDAKDDNLPDEILNKLLDVFEKRFISITIRAYIHSGITISTSSGYPYNDTWDSGVAGLIFVNNDKVKKKYNVKKISKKLKKEVIDILEGEVRILDQWLIGDVYRFERYKIKTCKCCGNKSKEAVDSCSGFYGSNIKKNGILNQIENFNEFKEVEVE